MKETDKIMGFHDYSWPEWGEQSDYNYLLNAKKYEIINDIKTLEKSRSKNKKEKLSALKMELLLEKEKSMHQFAWEFLRRNKQYQTDYKAHADYPSLVDLGAHADDPKFFLEYYDSEPQAQDGESYTEWSKRMLDEKTGNRYSAKMDNFIEKYDLQSRDDMKAYNPNNCDGPGFYCLNTEYPILRNQKISSLIGYSLRQDFSDEMVVKINVLLPIDEQFRRVTASARKDFRPSLGRKSGLHRHGDCLRRPWPSASPRL